MKTPALPIYQLLRKHGLQGMGQALENDPAITVFTPIATKELALDLDAADWPYTYLNGGSSHVRIRFEVVQCAPEFLSGAALAARGDAIEDTAEPASSEAPEPTRAKWLPLNVNENVRVKLTERGREIWRAHYAGYPTLAEGCHKVDSEGFIAIQLWQLMEILGPHISIGCDLAFETTILIPLVDAGQAPQSECPPCATPVAKD